MKSLINITFIMGITAFLSGCTQTIIHNNYTKEEKVSEKIEPPFYYANYNTNEKRTIGISDAGCSYITCPGNPVYNKKQKIEKKVEEFEEKESISCESCEIGGK